jgi:uncharacterized DUF497 family protein
MQTRFEWDAEKAKTNLIKHRVSFETAAQVFADPFAMVEQDRIEEGEYRWQTIGLVGGYLGYVQTEVGNNQPQEHPNDVQLNIK